MIKPTMEMQLANVTVASNEGRLADLAWLSMLPGSGCHASTCPGGGAAGAEAGCPLPEKGGVEALERSGRRRQMLWAAWGGLEWCMLN